MMNRFLPINFSRSFSPRAALGALVAGCALVACAPDETTTSAGGGEGELREESPISAFASNPDYVRVPSAYVHRSCVHQVADNALVDEDGNVTSPDGTEQHFGRCAYPTRFLNDRSKAAATPEGLSAPGSPETGGGPVATDNGWIEAAWWSSPHWMTYLSAEFHTPDAPPHYNGQTIFFFPSLEPTSAGSIVQTVLQYGASHAGGGEYWATASWYVSKAGTWVSPLKRAYTSDQLWGSMVGQSCDSEGRCTWSITTSNDTHASSTTLRIRSGYTMTQVQGGVLESYGVNTCADYPASHQLFENITVGNHLGQVPTPSFEHMYWRHTCHEAISTSGGDVRLYY